MFLFQHFYRHNVMWHLSFKKQTNMWWKSLFQIADLHLELEVISYDVIRFCCIGVSSEHCICLNHICRWTEMLLSQQCLIMELIEWKGCCMCLGKISSWSKMGSIEPKCPKMYRSCHLVFTLPRSPNM